MLGGNALVKRTGRKRKSGARKPSGDIRLATESPRVIAMRMPHRQSVKPDDRNDPMATSPLGRLHLRGFITLDQYLAGDRYALGTSRMLKLIAAPASSPPSIAGFGEPTKGGSEISDETAERWKAQYHRAYEAANKAGHLAMVALRIVAVQGNECPHGSFPHLLRGLKELEVFYGLTSGTKSDTRGK